MSHVPIVCPFLLPSSFTVWLKQNLFIHLSVDGYLSCFQFLTITHKAAMKMWVQSFKGYVPSILMGKHLEVERLDHTVHI